MPPELMPPQSTLGARLRALRAAAKISRPELATKAGVPYSSLTEWENDVSEPRWGAVVSLAQALGVDIHAFLPEGESADEE